MKKFRLINFPFWMKILFNLNFISKGVPFNEGTTKSTTFTNKLDFISKGQVYNTTNR